MWDSKENGDECDGTQGWSDDDGVDADGVGGAGGGEEEEKGDAAEKEEQRVTKFLSPSTPRMQAALGSGTKHDFYMSPEYQAETQKLIGQLRPLLLELDINTSSELVGMCRPTDHPPPPPHKHLFLRPTHHPQPPPQAPLPPVRVGLLVTSQPTLPPSGFEQRGDRGDRDRDRPHRELLSLLHCEDLTRVARDVRGVWVGGGG